jgi:TonB-dependent starch-binding outer membrane protein SusC
MKKKLILGFLSQKKCLQKISLIMKLSTFFLILGTLQCFSSGYGQSSIIKLEQESQSLLSVIEAIENQSDYKIFYKTDQVDVTQMVSIDEKEATVASVLNKALDGTHLSYVVMDKLIVFAREDALNQHGKVSGSITDATTGEPLIGVNVSIEGTTKGVISDINGNYTIEVPEENATLVFSYIGYAAVKIPVGGKITINVTLSPDIKNLEEVVVVGYGQQRKSDLTGSISSVKAKDLTLLPTQRVDQSLQGHAAGVTVTNTDGAPGGNTTIRIRGGNSLTGNSNALIVIDGLQGGDLRSLNPNDIESIEVLKDASAAAIYGSRGANGVILITTKKGKEGKPSVKYSYNGGFQKLANVIDVMNAGQFARAVNEFSATLDIQNPPHGFKPFTDEEVANFEKNGGTDWQREVYKTGKIDNHQLSIDGGTDNMNYFFSGGYLYNKGIMINSHYKRYSLRANINADVKKWLTVGLNWSGTKEESNVPPFGNGTASGVVIGQAANEAYLWDACTPVYDSDGNYMKHESGYGHDESSNPVLAAMETFNEIKTNTNNVNTYLDFKILKGLDLKVTGGAIIYNENNLRYLNRKTFEGSGVDGLGEVHVGGGSVYQNSNILTYNKAFNDRHRLIFTGVAEYQVDNYQYYDFQGDGFGTDVTSIYALSGATNLIVTANGISKRVLNSYLGRANYVFNNKYAITASYRADGSSVFGSSTKWGYFPSVALAWTASNETFIKDLNIFSNLKFRGSWGILGNQAVRPYSTLSTIAPGANYPYDGLGSTNIGYYAATAQNDKLKWESTEQINAGVDLGLFKGRLIFTFDIYKKTTTDMLLARQIPWYTGYGLSQSSATPSVMQNVGSMENKGIEFVIGGDPLVGNFRWNTSFIFSSNKSKILDLGGVQQLVQSTSQGGGYQFGNIAWLIVGEPLGTLKGHLFEGIWSTSEEAEANKFGQMPGDPKFKDLNGDYKINASDLTIIARTAPKFSIGFNNTFSYKAFELTATILGVYGNQIFNAGRIFTEKTNWGQLTGTSTRLLDHWTETNQDTDIPAWTVESYRVQYNLDHDITATNVSVNGRNSHFVEDGSFIRLKTLNLAYNFPQSVCQKIKIDRLRIYLSGTNLFTVTKYTGYDPEASSFSASDGRSGIDNSNYPQSKTYSMGIDVTF